MCFGKKSKTSIQQAAGPRPVRPARPQQAEDRQVIGQAGTIATLLAQHVENFYAMGSDLQRAEMIHKLSEDVMIFFDKKFPVDGHQGFMRDIKEQIRKPTQEVDRSARETHLQTLLDLCSTFGQLIRSQEAQWQFQPLIPFGSPAAGSTVTTFPALMKGNSQSRAADTMVV